MPIFNDSLSNFFMAILYVNIDELSQDIASLELQIKIGSLSNGKPY